MKISSFFHLTPTSMIRCNNHLFYVFQVNNSTGSIVIQASRQVAGTATGLDQHGQLVFGGGGGGGASFGGGGGRRRQLLGVFVESDERPERVGGRAGHARPPGRRRVARRDRSAGQRRRRPRRSRRRERAAGGAPGPDAARQVAARGTRVSPRRVQRRHGRRDGPPRPAHPVLLHGPTAQRHSTR